MEYLNFSWDFLIFSIYFILVALNFCLKFPVILKHSYKFLEIFLTYSFSGKVIGALSWNS